MIRKKSGSAPEEAGRWNGHPVLSLLVRTLVLIVPVGAGVGIAVLVGWALPAPASGIGTAGWWLLVVGCSTVAAWVADRLARRLIPLAVLLRLTLVFPDRAPSRYTLARAAGNTRLLERRVREARDKGVSDDPTRAAEMVLTLVAALSAHDRRTRGHSERVRAFVDLLADELKLSPDVRARLRWAALLHDIGKLQVAAEILNKPSKLDQDEWEAIQAHPEAGSRLAGPLLPWLGEWGRAIVDHHERFDGTGYPGGRRGDEISLAGRITGIADSFETMTAARSYKKPMTVAAARRELTRCAGTQFDPVLVRAFLNVSIGRLMWSIGPMTWLAQIPIVGRLTWVGPQTAAAARSAALAKTLAGIVALGVSGGVGSQAVRATEPPSPRLEPRVVQVAIAEDSGQDLRDSWTTQEGRGQRKDKAGAADTGGGKTKDDSRADEAGTGGSEGSDGSLGPDASSGSDGSGATGGSGGSSGSGGSGGSESPGPVEKLTGQVQDTVDSVGETADSLTDEVTGAVDEVTGAVENGLDSLPSAPLP